MILNTGMLWFDNNPKTDLFSKIRKAADYYQHKYGSKPDLCYVNPRSIAEQSEQTIEIQVQSSQKILPNHIWIGVSEDLDTQTEPIFI